MWTITGSLTPVPALSAPDLLAGPVVEALRALDAADADRCAVVEIDPSLADTAEFCATYGSPLSASANCVVVAGKRGAAVRYAACLVLATTRADVNGVVRRRLDARKASFAPMDDAVSLTGMAHGGITPVGLPADWPLLLAPEVAAAPELVIGSGVRRSKLLVPGDVLVELPNAEVVEGLAS
ncbi:YbaK/EbsC family protein [Umezawaea beigongshangensis]|uniref:YbaK/EbsC family protein n=1 Tax=Umezawaea beigongshangensis TaxID=2780383 RepID=UPI003F686E96